MRPSLILDIDLDYFVNPVVKGKGYGHNRPPSETYFTRGEASVREFLEERCLLSLDAPVAGAACEYHCEVFHRLDGMIGASELTTPFVFAHVDAHDDMGGDCGSLEVTSANFLLQCVRRDWIKLLILMLPESERCLPEYLIKYDPPRIEIDGHRSSLRLPDEVEFKLPIKPDFCFVTRSPDFTPSTADPVYDLIRSYIHH